MSRLLIDPATLDARGREITDSAETFMGNNKKIYETVQNMVNSEYLSPEARVLADKIMSYQDELDTMGRYIDEYGTFLKTTARKFLANQDEIISHIKSKNPNINI